MDIILRGYIETKLFFDRLRQQAGQGSLEYIAIVLGIVIIVAGIFFFAGKTIKNDAGGFVDDVLNP